jgi:CRISPR-associated protein Cas5d
MSHAWNHPAPIDKPVEPDMEGLSFNVFRIRITGDFACFTRPEFKAERRSYDVITPTAVLGILENVFWKPEMRYEVLRIYVEKPIRFMTVTMNEVERPTSPDSYSAKSTRIQRTTSLLRDVSYVAEVRIDGDDPQKYFNMATRRLRQKQYFHTPFLGCREYVGRITLLSPHAPIHPISLTRDLGMMFRHRKWSEKKLPGTRRSQEIEQLSFFRAQMTNGIIDIPPVQA